VSFISKDSSGQTVRNFTANLLKKPGMASSPIANGRRNIRPTASQIFSVLNLNYRIWVEAHLAFITDPQLRDALRLDIAASNRSLGVAD